MFTYARRLLLCGLVAAALVLPAPGLAQSSVVDGTIVDVTGAVVAGADVTARTADGRTLTTTSAPDGAFSFAVPVTSVRVTAAGFAPAEIEAINGTLRIELRPAGISDSLVVTATRGADRLPSAASATVLTSAELNNSAAGALDDTLRSTPGFSLFRRQSSRVANPTTQGVTLRGVSGSGASRTLVLADGVPLNDPFGSWVYWNRIPQASLDRVEVVRGATGDLYGADALGGVVQLLTFQPDRTRARATIDGGSLDTFRGSLFAGTEYKRWELSGAYEGTTTDGTYTVAPEARGAVDIPADSDYNTGFVTGGRRGDTWHANAKVALYAEDRGNGTPVTVNTTDWSQVSGNVGGNIAGGAWQAQAAGSSQDYYQTFSAVALGRATERLTTEQTTDTSYASVGGQWTRPLGRITVIAGGDFQRTESEVMELRYSVTNVQTGPFFAGGTERSSAMFARASLPVNDRLTVDLGGRVDWWKSTPTNTALPEKSVTFFSPRAAVAYRLGDVSLQGAVYRANRPPTLNELHRGFRVGSIVTNPNPLLDPEELTGVEGGVLVSRGRVSARATAFYNDLDGAIANITVSETPTQITRERRNSDTIRATGLELEADARLTSTLSVNGQFVFTSSHFRGSVATPAIEGNQVPQVPEVQGGVGLTWADARWVTAAMQVRFSGDQYDDDLNQFVLGGFGVVDLQVSRAVTSGFVGFLSVENLFDEVYDAGRTPIRLVGWPRTVRVGVRIALR